MIRTAVGDDFFLITQDDHARLSGAMAARVGNETFQRPSPEVVAAISLHDAGWPLHDDAPTLNPRGVPLKVFESPANVAVPVWTESVRRAAEAGPYAQLLVSVHALSLSAMALASPSLGRTDQFTLLKFQQQQVERQEELRGRLGLSTGLPLHNGLAKPGTNQTEDLLAFNYGLLRALDRVSLEICFGGGMFNSIDGVIPQLGANPVELRINTIQSPAAATDPSVELVIKPWPFDAPELTFATPAKRVPSMPYQDTGYFRETYEAAPIVRVIAKLRQP